MLAAHLTRIERMAYTVLARRYRSQTFDDVVGQNHVAQTLKKAIASGRIAHAYLFCGTRGTGKTSMARIFAKALNCQKSDGPTAEPCLKCASCTAIARGDDMDVIELDAASNTQVDKTREVVIDNAQYRPAHSRFKIYIIDEAHMLSKSSFNALLKTLEEPPEHVKFILATTEPEKLPNTILSRCQRYDFRNIPTREIAAHLKEISKQEKIKADDDALMLVAKAGAGSMRDALSLLDRLLSIGEKQLTVETIESLLGLPRGQALLELAQSIGEGDVKQTLIRADRLITEGLAPDSLVVSLTDHFRNLLLIRTCGADSDLVEAGALSPQELATQAQRFDPVTLTQDIAILEELRRQMRQSQAGRALLDATLVRLALADQFSSIGELLSTVDKSPSLTPAQKKKPDPIEEVEQARELVATVFTRGMGAPPMSPKPQPEPAEAIASTATAYEPSSSTLSDIDLGSDDDLPRPGKVWDGPSQSLGTLLKQHAQSARPDKGGPSSAASNVEPVAFANMPGLWQNLLNLLLQEKPGMQAFVSHGSLVAVEDNQAIIRYTADRAPSYNMMTRNGKKELVADALSRLLGRAVGVRFELDTSTESPPPSFTAAPASAPSRLPRPAAPPPEPEPAQNNGARVTPDQAAEFEKDPLIAALLSNFNATMIRIRSQNDE